MAPGLPVVSFDCPSGPMEIIRHGVDGILLPPENMLALADAMQELMENPEERDRLSLRAVEVTHRFGIESVMSTWEDLLQKVWKGLR